MLLTSQADWNRLGEYRLAKLTLDVKATSIFEGLAALFKTQKESLQELNLFADVTADVTNEAVEALCQMVNLRKLGLFNFQNLTSRMTFALRGFPLEQLQLEGSYIRHEVFPALRSIDLPLKKLGLFRCNLDEVDYRDLAGIPLEWLDLRRAPIDDNDFASLEVLGALGLPLKTLILYECYLTADDLLALQGCSELECLDLAFARISRSEQAACLNALRGFPKLKRLIVDFVRGDQPQTWCTFSDPVVLESLSTVPGLKILSKNFRGLKFTDIDAV